MGGGKQYSVDFKRVSQLSYYQGSLEYLQGPSYV